MPAAQTETPTATDLRHLREFIAAFDADECNIGDNAHRPSGTPCRFGKRLVALGLLRTITFAMSSGRSGITNGIYFPARFAPNTAARLLLSE